MIRANASRYPISAQCRILGVPRSTYYWMIEHPEAERVDPIAGDVHAVRRDSHERYGARKIKAAHAVERFARDFMALDGDPDRVRPVTCDMGPGFAKGHPRPLAQRGQNHRQVPCRQTRQRGRRQGPQGRGQGEPAAQTHEVPVARERVQPHGPAAGGQARSGEAAVEDRQGVRDARTPAGHPRRQRQPHGGGGRVQGIALVDDAFASGTDEGPRRTVPPALAGHPRLLRPSARQRDPRGTERHHPARQDPLPRLREHGLLRHHDLPDLRQTRPQHRHRLTRFTHTKQRKACNTMCVASITSGFLPMSRLYTADACAVMKTAVGSLRMRRRRQRPATEAT